MARKSENEIELIRESGRWCAHAHRLLQEYTRPGVDRGRGEPAGRAGDDARDARGARRRSAGSSVVGRRVGRLPRADRRCAARGRTRSRTTSSSRPATCSSPRRARRSGATTPSSSAAWSSARRPTRCGGSSTTSSRRSRPRSPRSGPARRAPTSTAPSCATSRSNDLLPYWRQHTGHGDRAAQPRGAVPRPRRPHRRSSRAWSSRSSRACTTRAIGGFRHSDTVVVTERRDARS